MVQVYIEYKEEAISNLRALMFLLDLRGIKHEEKIINSLGNSVYGHSYGIKITYMENVFLHLPTFVRKIARETGLECGDDSRIQVNL